MQNVPKSTKKSQDSSVSYLPFQSQLDVWLKSNVCSFFNYNRFIKRSTQNLPKSTQKSQDPKYSPPFPSQLRYSTFECEYIYNYLKKI